MVWNTNKQTRQANIQLEHNMLCDWPISSQPKTAIISTKEQQLPDDSGAKWLTGRLCVITYRAMYSITNISHT